MRRALLALFFEAFFIPHHPAFAEKTATSADVPPQQSSDVAALPERPTYEAGVEFLQAATPERGGEVEITVWYPTESHGSRTLIGDGNPLFKGTSAIAEAPTARGTWPLIIHSQGGLRAGPNLGAWMASRLAARGFIVAMLRQPDPTRLTEEQTLPEIWLRPSDISAALTAILSHGTFSTWIDKARIGVLGFQIGGTAALAIAGGLLDVAKVKGSCDVGAVPGVDCGRFQRAGLDLHDVDMPLLGRSNVDSRVKAIVVIDPEFSREFTETSLSRVSIPVSVANLGQPDLVWPGLNSEGLRRSVPGARYVVVPDATQYSAFPECKPEASTILRKDGEEALCDDLAGGRSRMQVHDAIAGMVAAWLHSDLGASSQNR